MVILGVCEYLKLSNTEAITLYLIPLQIEQHYSKILNISEIRKLKFHILEYINTPVTRALLIPIEVKRD